MSEPSRQPILQASPLAGYLAHQADVDAAIARASASGNYILGPEVAAFEREFASYIGVAHGAGVANGTDAVELALRACGVERGDLVFTVSHTAVATVAAIDRIGAVSVLVDIEPATFTMSPEQLEGAIAHAKRSPQLAAARARAIVPVHLYGHPCDMPAIVEIARRERLRVVEDCAQAHGAALGDRRVGTWGDLAAFSLYPTKNLAALGDGGIVVGADEALVQRVRVLRQYGWEERYISSIPGCNSRLDELQAAILRAKLTMLDLDNERRRSLAQRYDVLLAEIPVERPASAPGAHHVFHQYVIRTVERNALRRHLAAEQIGTAVHYPVPVHLQPAYRGSVPVYGRLHHTETAANDVLSLPMYPQLDFGQIDIVCNAIARWASMSPATT